MIAANRCSHVSLPTKHWQHCTDSDSTPRRHGNEKEVKNKSLGALFAPSCCRLEPKWSQATPPPFHPGTPDPPPRWFISSIKESTSQSNQIKSNQFNSIQFKSIQVNSNQFKSIQINHSINLQIFKSSNLQIFNSSIIVKSIIKHHQINHQ